MVKAQNVIPVCENTAVSKPRVLPLMRKYIQLCTAFDNEKQLCYCNEFAILYFDPYFTVLYFISVLLCSPSWLQTFSPTFTSRVLELQMCTTMPSPYLILECIPIYIYKKSTVKHMLV
jgi:hypothetical protein